MKRGATLTIAWLVCGCGQSSPTPGPPAMPRTLAEVGLDADLLDARAAPCVDFQRYACGGWLERRAVDGPLDRLTELQTRVAGELGDILRGGGRALDRVHKFRAACLAGTAGLDAVALFAAVGPLRNRADLVATLATLHTHGVPTLFSTRIVESKGQRQLSIEPVAPLGAAELSRLLSLRARGGGAGSRLDELERALAGEGTALARALTLAELGGLAPGFDWTIYLELRGVPERSVLADPAFISRIGKAASERPLADLESSMVAHLAAVAEALVAPVDESECDRTTAALFPATLTRAFAEAHWSADGQRASEELVAAFASAASRAAKRDVGVPWQPVDEAFEVGGSYADNVLAARAARTRQEIAALAGNTSPRAFVVAPFEPRAAYDNDSDRLIVPAAVLAAPFFQARADISVNCGGLAPVVGLALVGETADPDLDAVRIARAAHRSLAEGRAPLTVAGHTETQLFFLALGQASCQAESARLNTLVARLPEFAEAFACPAP